MKAYPKHDKFEDICCEPMRDAISSFQITPDNLTFKLPIDYDTDYVSFPIKVCPNCATPIEVVE